MASDGEDVRISPWRLVNLKSRPLRSWRGLNFSFKRQEEKGDFPFLALCILSIMVVIFEVLAYGNTWQNGESASNLFAKVHGWHDFLMLNLNFIPLEDPNRYTRPLEILLRGIDYYFRCALWIFIPPHPTLSIPVLLILVAGPILLWKYFINAGYPRHLSRILLIFYLLSPGTTLLSSSYFRPAKPMVNFFMAFFLYYGQKLWKELQERGEVDGKRYGLFLLTLYLSFFFDETALYLYPWLFALYPRLFWARRRLWKFLLLPVMVFLNFFFFLPNFYRPYVPVPDLTQYQHFAAIPGMVRGILQAPLAGARGALDNSKLVMEDLLGINPFREVQKFPLLTALFFLHAFLLGAMSLLVLSKRKEIPHRETCKLALIFICGLLLHDLLTRVKIHPYGILWYGSFLTIPFVVLLGRFLLPLSRHRVLLFSFTIISMLDLSIKFRCTNFVYERMGDEANLFNGLLNRYVFYAPNFLTVKKSEGNFRATWELWRKLKNPMDSRNGNVDLCEAGNLKGPFRYVCLEARFFRAPLPDPLIARPGLR